MSIRFLGFAAVLLQRQDGIDPELGLAEEHPGNADRVHRFLVDGNRDSIECLRSPSGLPNDILSLIWEIRVKNSANDRQMDRLDNFLTRKHHLPMNFRNTIHTVPIWDNK